MRHLVVLASITLISCSSHGLENARKCAVTEAQLNTAIDEVAKMTPYSGKRLGKCDLIVDEGHNVSIITPEIQQRVEKMMAREKAGSTE